MGTTNSKHPHGGLRAAFAQQPFANIRGCNKGKCIMHTVDSSLYYPGWDHRVRQRTTLPNLLEAKPAYERD